MKILKVSIGKVENWEKNPRGCKKEGFERLKKQITKLGVYKPLLVYFDIHKKKYVSLGGNMRLRALRDLKYTDVDISLITPKNEAEKLEYALSDNDRIGYYEEDALAELIEQNKKNMDMDIFKVDTKEPIGLDEILALSGIGGEVIEDEVPEPPKKAKTKPGQLYVLGNHRLLCGDATKKKDVDKLMAGQKADMIFTDPPYNLNYKYNNYRDDKTREEYFHFCSIWFKLLNMFSNGKIIITIGKQNLGLWYSMGEPTEIAVWIHKNGVSGGRVSNLSLWEPIIFYGKHDRNSRANNLFEYDLKRQLIGETGNEHSCPKQVQMIMDIVKSYSREKKLILDIFGGSGTTLIACEQLNRKCFMMEIDPIYCDVIVNRWEIFTKRKAKKI